MDIRRGERILFCEFVEEYKGCVRDSFSSFIVLRIKIGDGSGVQFW